MAEIISKEKLISDLKGSGISKGDTLFLRISYKSIGKVEGGPVTVIKAIMEVIGEEGNIVVTAFPRRYYSFNKFLYRKKAVSQTHKLPTNVGVIPRIISEMNNSQTTGHLTYPFVILGKDAKEIANCHTNQSKPYDIIVNIANNYNAKCLRVGGDVLTGTTHIAFTKALESSGQYQKDLEQGLWTYDDNHPQIKVWQGDNVSFFCYRGYKTFYNKFIGKYCELYKGKLGDGEMVLTSMKRTLEIETRHLYCHPELLLCDDPSCATCRTSYSYSTISYPVFIIQQLRHLFEREKRKSVKRSIIISLARMFWGVKIR